MTSFTCNKCNTSSTISNSITILSFGCPNCNSYYTHNYNEFKFEYKSNFEFSNPVIPIGSKCKLDNEEYEVIGMIVKDFGNLFYSTEYTLLSNKGDYKYLSESQGHWILLKEVEKINIDKNSKLELTYNEILFKKYDHYYAEIVLIQGFFDIKLNKRKSFVVEYISPPYILSSENLDDIHTYFGEHISKEEIKNIFNLEQLPSTVGIGIVQPFYVNIVNSIRIFLATCIIILLIYAFGSRSNSEQVLSSSFRISDYKTKEYVSPSFEFTGSASTLNVEINTSVDNSWAYTGVSVINELTNEEVFAEQNIEYYHGYTDGENWNEGSTSEKFSICGLKAGKYHLTFTPQAEEILINPPTEELYNQNPNTTFDSSKAINKNDNLVMSVTATLEKSPFWNVGFCFIIFGIVIIILHILKYFFEVKRWNTSDYSPYRTDE